MSSLLRTVFFGSPALAIPSLRAILRSEEIKVEAVVTQPDRPAGRGRRMQPPPVKEAALAAGLEVLQAKSIRTSRFAERMTGFNPDIFAVVAYGKILSAKLLEIPQLGCINLHFSLLPRYRGAAPVNRALINGETVTGVTTMLMDEGMDTGPILLQQEVEIMPDETAGELATRLAELGAQLLVLTLQEHAAGRITPIPQDNDRATYAPMLKKEEGLVDWTRRAGEIVNLWQGLHPWPGIYSFFRKQPIKLLEVHESLSPASKAEPGLFIQEEDRLYVACGDKTRLELLKVQPAGKKAIDVPDFLRGYRIAEGERLGGSPEND